MDLRHTEDTGNQELVNNQNGGTEEGRVGNDPEGGGSSAGLGSPAAIAGEEQS